MRKSLISVLVLVLAAIHFPTPGLAGNPIGEVTVGGGVVFPQADAARYSDVGGTLYVRVTPRLSGFKALGGWIDAAFVGLASDTQDAGIPVIGGTEIPIEQTTSEVALSSHAGLQLGGPSRHSFFRPRAGAGLGIYYFSSSIEWTGLNQDEPLAKEFTDSQVRFGWRGILGADFFFDRKWGLGLEFLYDQVWNLDQVDGEEAPGISGRFLTYAVTVVIPFEQVN